MKRKDFKPSKTSVVCSEHFEEHDYYHSVMDTKVLLRTAVPSKFNFPVSFKKPAPKQRKTRTSSTSEPSTSTSNEYNNILPVEEMASNDVVTVNNSNLTSTTTKQVISPLKRKQPHYFGNFIENDLSCPVKRKKFWQLSKHLVESQKKKIKYYETQTRRLRKKIVNLENLVDHLLKTRNISGNCASVLKV